MARPPLDLGTYGRISFTEFENGAVAARARFRDFDGLTRLVERRGPSKTAAERALKAALVDRQHNVADAQITSSMRLRDLARLWLDEVDGSDRKQGTKDRYRYVVQEHVNPGMGDLLLREATVGSTDRFVKAIKERHGAATAKTCRTCLSQMFGLALRHDVIRTNPCVGLSEIPRASKPARALTLTESQQLLAKLRNDPLAVAHDLPDLVAFMLGTGCRIGEALALLMADVELADEADEGTAHIHATVTDRGRQESTKTDAGDRRLPLPPGVVRMLRARLANEAIATDVCVFPSPKGHLRDTSNTAAHLRRALDRAGFKWVKSHTFRKTVATRMDEAGLTARQIADHLGHSQVSMTTDVYMGRRVATAAAASVLDSTDLFV